MKLALTIALVTALQAIILATPALAQSGRPHVVHLRPILITGRTTAPRDATDEPAAGIGEQQHDAGDCYTRPLVQGSGSVRVCG